MAESRPLFGLDESRMSAPVWSQFTLITARYVTLTGFSHSLVVIKG